jgi:flavin reductase (DIM6/NTAB) family NADH-FMN oxidoreductase RutF
MSAAPPHLSSASDAPTPELLRQAFGTFTTGVTVIGARRVDGALVGMTANSFTSVSLTPPLVLFCPARSLAGFDTYATVAHFSISILPRQTELVSNHFARSGIDKWKSVPHSLGATGVPLLDFALATMECEVVARHSAGDHLVVVGRVLRVEVSDAAEPLVFFRSRYRQLDAHMHPVQPEGDAPFDVWG